MGETYESNRNVFYSCHYHVVWCPKYRRKVLIGPIETRLKEILRQACQEYQAEVEELEVMPDHVHLLVSVDPQFGIHRLVKLLKGRSSRFLRQEFPALKRKVPSLWTNSYFVGTTGGAPLSIINQSIEQQEHVSARETEKREKANQKLPVPLVPYSQARAEAGGMAGVVLRDVQCGA